MRKLALIILSLLLLGCSTIHYVPVKTETVVKQIDSIAWHDSIIYHYIPVEKYTDLVLLKDTLKLETSLARAEAYIDTTTNTLKGNIENKKDSIKYIIKWKERLVYRDSIVTKEVPVEVEIEKTVIPKWCWHLLIYTIVSIVMIVLRIYFKIIK